MNQEKSKTILLVEPVQNYRMFIERALVGSEFEVMATRNGKEALSLLTGFQPDVLLMEDNLPEMDGPAFLLQVREKGLNIPAIILSASGESHRLAQYASLAVSDILIKPIEPERLLGRIRAAIDPLTDVDSFLSKLPGGGSGGPPILIVDDVGASRLMLATHLKANGFTPLEAAEGSEALQCIQSGEISLVLLDYQMRGMGGLKTLRQIRKQNNPIPVILLSAHATPEEVTEARGLGIVAFFPKPVDIPRLVVRIREILGSEEKRTLGEKGTILVVDDEPGMRKVMQMLLSSAGYTVRTAEDGFAARNELLYSCPSLVVLDLNLPGVDGTQIIREIEADHPNLPVVVISGYLREENVKEIQKGCVQAVFHKPVNMQEFRATVESLLAN